MERHQFLSAGALAVVIVVVSIVSGSAAGQDRSRPAAATATTAAKKSIASRTPWGDPDLQGVWSYATVTPLERAQAGKEALSDEEVATVNSEAGADRRDGGAEADLARAYNAFW